MASPLVDLEALETHLKRSSQKPPSQKHLYDAFYGIHDTFGAYGKETFYGAFYVELAKSRIGRHYAHNFPTSDVAMVVSETIPAEFVSKLFRGGKPNHRAISYLWSMIVWGAAASFERTYGFPREGEIALACITADGERNAIEDNLITARRGSQLKLGCYQKTPQELELEANQGLTGRVLNYLGLVD